MKLKNIPFIETSSVFQTFYSIIMIPIFIPIIATLLVLGQGGAITIFCKYDNLLEQIKLSSEKRRKRKEMKNIIGIEKYEYAGRLEIEVEALKETLELAKWIYEYNDSCKKSYNIRMKLNFFGLLYLHASGMNEIIKEWEKFFPNHCHAIISLMQK